MKRLKDGRYIPDQRGPLQEWEIEALKNPDLNPSNVERDRLAERNWRNQFQTPSEQFLEAAKAADERHPEIVSDPILLAEAAIRAKHQANRAVAAGRAIDWNATLGGAIEEVREAAGLPSTAERDRLAILDDMHVSRGLTRK